ncbi:MAG: hypothetical protein H6881_10425 [Rhodobiaceae bacterium]|nr:hypothetical protein [Rhodobiaceae bacterium]
MESFERWDFVIWQEAGGDAARAPLASRDAVQSAKGQVQAIMMDLSLSTCPSSPGLDVFSAPASSKASHDALHRACGFSSLTRKILSIKSLPAKDDRL